VLFLHGLLGDMYHWRRRSECAGGDVPPIALTLPVFDPRLAEATIGELGRHIARFLDALDLGRVVLAGNSLGGHVALHVALAIRSGWPV
jgi:pimeloyl-ACP methyl ester carboxylesterase